MQALERHQAQQRLWANSVGSTVDATHSPGASPRGGGPPDHPGAAVGGHPRVGTGAVGGPGFSANGLLAAQQQLVAAAHAAGVGKDGGRLPAGDFMVGRLEHALPVAVTAESRFAVQKCFRGCFNLGMPNPAAHVSARQLSQPQA